MNCPTCGHENRESARFCGERAASLGRQITCSVCGTANPPSQKFCDSCGVSLVEGQESKVESPQPRSSTLRPFDSSTTPRAHTPKHLADKILQSKSTLEGERKQVTVLFADVKGSMELLRRYTEELKRTRGVSFAVRMGINSGEVVVGSIDDDLRMEYTAQCHTVGLASRMEQLAGADRRGGAGDRARQRQWDEVRDEKGGRPTGLRARRADVRR